MRHHDDDPDDRGEFDDFPTLGKALDADREKLLALGADPGPLASDIFPSTIEQTPRSEELDGALACEPDSHVWRVIAEDASPSPHQTCRCGARRWNNEHERITTGSRSSPT